MKHHYNLRPGIGMGSRMTAFLFVLPGILLAVLFTSLTAGLSSPPPLQNRHSSVTRCLCLRAASGKSACARMDASSIDGHPLLYVVQSYLPLIAVNETADATPAQTATTGTGITLAGKVLSLPFMRSIFVDAGNLAD